MDWTLLKHKLVQKGGGGIGFKYMGERNRDNQTQVRSMRELGRLGAVKRIKREAGRTGRDKTDKIEMLRHKRQILMNDTR